MPQSICGSNRRLQYWQALIWILGFESMAACIFTLLQPWMGGVPTFLQLICAAATGITGIFLVVAGIFILSNPSKINCRLQRMQDWLGDGGRIAFPVVVILFLTASSLVIVSLIFSLPEARFLWKWVDVYLQCISAFALILIACLQFIVHLFFVFGSSLLQPDKESLQHTLQWLTVYIILIVTGFQWMTLIFQVDIFGLIPGWFWKIQIKAGDLQYGYWLLNLITLAACAGLVLFKRGSSHFKMILLFMTGITLQASYGFMDGGGFDSLRLKFAGSMHRVYAEFACDRPAVLQALLNYEELYGWNNYLGTKPPGVLLIYVLTQKMSAIFLPSSDFEGRFMNMTRWMAFTFPILSMTVLFPLYHFSRHFLPGERAFYPLLLYIISPNVLLIPLFLDQALYPTLFVCGLWLVQLALKRNQVLLFFLSGVFIYACLYFTFSLLPLLPLVVIWLVLNGFVSRDQGRWRHAVRMLLAFGVGLLFMFVVLRFVLNFDIFTRYQVAMEHHQMLKVYKSGLGFLLGAILLNQVDFSSWSGFGVCILAVWRGFRAVANGIKARVTAIETLVLSAFLTYGALNLFGKTRGEVGRIWLFMVPLVCLLAVDEVLHLFKRNRAAMMGLLALQSVTTLLLFLFQDFFS